MCVALRESIKREGHGHIYPDLSCDRALHNKANLTTDDTDEQIQNAPIELL
jgi:hypothetical protein